MEKYLLKIDITGKQEYIFATNRLKDAVGASEVVRFVSEDLGGLLLEEIDGLKNEEFSKGNTDGNVLFIGGGNSVYIFKDENSSKEFASRFSEIVLRFFPGLDLLMAGVKINLDEGESIKKVIEYLDLKLEKKKLSGIGNINILGYGITELCRNNKKPAGYEVHYGGETSRVSKEILSKVTFYNMTRRDYKNYPETNCMKTFREDFFKELKINDDNYREKLLKKVVVIKEREDWKIEEKVEFESFTTNRYEYCDEVDYIGGEIGERSYIGVSCTDGNGIGEMFRKIEDNIENYSYIDKVRRLSKEVEAIFLGAVEHVTNYCVENKDVLKQKLKLQDDEVKTRNEKYTEYIPMRPIVVAGDDITIVTNAKIVLEVTHELLKYIERANKSKKKKSKEEIGAGTGISIVKTKYPFSRAVDFAEKIQKDVKVSIRKIQKDEEKINIMDKQKLGMSWEVVRGEINPENSRKINMIWDLDGNFINTDKNIEWEKFKTEMNRIRKLNGSTEGSKGKYINLFRSSQISNAEKTLFEAKYMSGETMKELYLEKVMESINLFQTVKGEN